VVDALLTEHAGNSIAEAIDSGCCSCHSSHSADKCNPQMHPLQLYSLFVVLYDTQRMKVKIQVQVNNIGKRDSTIYLNSAGYAFEEQILSTETFSDR